MTRTLVVNSIAGPGAGKSTLSFGLIAKLKANHFKAELVQEHAKELVYRRDWKAIADQGSVTREQDRRLRDLIGHVDIVVHDTAIPLGIIYAQEGEYREEWFRRRCWELFEGYNNFTIFVKRVKPFLSHGRYQTEEESKVKDQEILDLFRDKIDLFVDGNDQGVQIAYDAVMNQHASIGSQVLR